MGYLLAVTAFCKYCLGEQGVSSSCAMAELESPGLLVTLALGTLEQVSPALCSLAFTVSWQFHLQNFTSVCLFPFLPPDSAGIAMSGALVLMLCGLGLSLGCSGLLPLGGLL